MDRITETTKIIKFRIKSNLRDLFVVILIIIVAVSSFFVGRASVQNGNIINNSNEASVLISTKPLSITSRNGEVVGSRASKKYYLPWCSTALNISDSNKVVFKSADEAKSEGYIPGGNCKGIY